MRALWLKKLQVNPRAQSSAARRPVAAAVGLVRGLLTLSLALLCVRVQVRPRVGRVARALELLERRMPAGVRPIRGVLLGAVVVGVVDVVARAGDAPGAAALGLRCAGRRAGRWRGSRGPTLPPRGARAAGLRRPARRGEQQQLARGVLRAWQGKTSGCAAPRRVRAREREEAGGAARARGRGEGGAAPRALTSSSASDMAEAKPDTAERLRTTGALSRLGSYGQSLDAGSVATFSSPKNSTRSCRPSDEPPAAAWRDELSSLRSAPSAPPRTTAGQIESVLARAAPSLANTISPALAARAAPPKPTRPDACALGARAGLRGSSAAEADGADASFVIPDGGSRAAPRGGGHWLDAGLGSPPAADVAGAAVGRAPAERCEARRANSRASSMAVWKSWRLASRALTRSDSRLRSNE